MVGLLQSGETVDSVIANCFPDLTRAQVYACLAYYEDHRDEIDVLVAREMSAGGDRVGQDVRDYTRERDQWLSGLTIEQIEDEIRRLRARGEI